ncbi:ATP phosphoribosyltransferase regulatory subunit [Fodinicurvata sp. CAU 1616]|uniref:ATP phosphoribosyltransferase regulatory subunit n=1 Tax=Aquibaculum arenosum TaxID=3032591 RepID=A0ABT5YNG6_9PROT|nr:ATP phosphoribosyltransferase regulatory subunit [Fodinicurvata sp. CAU 1616]MDF2096363.1 ATP phosphoribosyltransferase regulatory subunit [Fodinicurvata sp. CAU 1616]
MSITQLSDVAGLALLPAGLQDGLPPDAAHEAALVEQMIATLAGYGYERVKPPLLEFEDSLLAGPGEQVAQQTFRLMDPISQRMMGLRADMTPQVARIAASRLGRAPRPLRLCYAGEVLRVRGNQLRPERQFAQVGAELLGSDAPAADAEVVRLAADALQSLGLKSLSIDLSLPTLVGGLLADLHITEDAGRALRSALDRKDAAAVHAAAGDSAPLFDGLLRAVGPVGKALPALQALDLPEAARREVAGLAQVVEQVAREAPELRLTVDPVEHRGYEYQTGLSFTLFATGVRGELGRGGRYAAIGAQGVEDRATGFTLFMDTLLRALPAVQRRKRVYLPIGTDPAQARGLRATGWVTVAGLEPVADPLAEAQRLQCGHLLQDGVLHEVENE